jgi:hypothetical protein
MSVHTLRDTPNFLTQLRDYQPAGGRYYQIATVDVNSMYPSLNLDKVLPTLEAAIRQRVAPEHSTYIESLVALMRHLMHNCYVAYDGVTY